jgi:hypothetical protein
VTDGRAGIEAQALGLAEAVSRITPYEIVAKRIAIAAPFRSLPRALWGDPVRRLALASADVGPPYPDLFIGCGRLAVPIAMAIKARAPETFVVMLQNPRARLSAFDLVIPPVHDGLEGENVFPIVGAPNRLDAAALLAERASARPDRVCVLIGGPNRVFRFDETVAQSIAEALRAVKAGGAKLFVTLSRRTPRAAAAIISTALDDDDLFFDPAAPVGSNPYLDMLARASAVLVTEDSVNMAAEAASTGAPVHVFSLPRKPFARAAKFDAFHASLAKRGASRPFAGKIEDWRYEPLDETRRAAAETVRRISVHRATRR